MPEPHLGREEVLIRESVTKWPLLSKTALKGNFLKTKSYFHLETPECFCFDNKTQQKVLQLRVKASQIMPDIGNIHKKSPNEFALKTGIE